MIISSFYYFKNTFKTIIISSIICSLFLLLLYNIIEDPSQQNDIAEQHPEMVKQYREVYEVWWTDVSERFDEYAGIIIGSKFENPVAQ